MLLEITRQADILSTAMAASHLARALALCLTAAFASPGQNQPVPPRDNAPVDAAGTGTIRGRVTDRETGQPLGRVMVTLISTAWRDQAMSSSAMIAQTGIADDSSLKQNQPRQPLPLRTAVSSSKRSCPAPTRSPSRRRCRAERISIRVSGSLALGIRLKPGRRVPPIELRDGETRDNVDIALWRAFAVEGRVVDDAGEPIANADVNISQWESPSTMSMGRPRVTDDRGMFRIFGLRPGQYRICAEGGMHFGPSEDSQG